MALYFQTLVVDAKVVMPITTAPVASPIQNNVGPASVIVRLLLCGLAAWGGEVTNLISQTE